MPFPATLPFVSDDMIEQVTATLHDALSMRGQAADELSVDHEGLTLGGSVDRYVFTLSQGSLIIDFTQLGEARYGVDRIVVESRPDVVADQAHATNLSATLELYADSEHLGWTYQMGAEAVITLDRLMDLLHIMARTYQQMQDTAKFIEYTATSRQQSAALSA